MKRIFFSIILILFAITTAVIAAPSIKEGIFNKEKGFFTCNGGSSAPLFKQDCRELTLDRVSFGGDIVYEGWCLDSNGTKYILSCENFAFEPEKITNNTKKNYFDQ